MEPQSEREILIRRSQINKNHKIGGGSDVEKGKIWDSPLLKHLLAWILLMVVGVAMWNMAAPARDYMQEKEKTATSSTVKNSDIEQSKQKSQITTTTSLQGVDQQQKTHKVEVVINALNIRAEPSSKGLKIGKLRKGTVIQVLEVSGKWLKIKTGDNKVGYISSDKRLIKVVP